jgi:hypothetical protein
VTESEGILTRFRLVPREWVQVLPLATDARGNVRCEYLASTSLKWDKIREEIVNNFLLSVLTSVLKGAIWMWLDEIGRI